MYQKVSNKTNQKIEDGENPFPNSGPVLHQLVNNHDEIAQICLLYNKQWNSWDFFESVAPSLEVHHCETVPESYQMNGWDDQMMLLSEEVQPRARHGWHPENPLVNNAKVELAFNHCFYVQKLHYGICDEGHCDKFHHYGVSICLEFLMGFNRQNFVDFFSAYFQICPANLSLNLVDQSFETTFDTDHWRLDLRRWFLVS